MKHFSNRYIFIFSAIMVVIVAALLSLAATLLQPARKEHWRSRKRKVCLNRSGFRQHVKIRRIIFKSILESFVLNSKGGEVVEGNRSVHGCSEGEQKKPLEQQALPVFRAGNDEGEPLIILPVEGKDYGGLLTDTCRWKDMSVIYGDLRSQGRNTRTWCRDQYYTF